MLEELREKSCMCIFFSLEELGGFEWNWKLGILGDIGNS